MSTFDMDELHAAMSYRQAVESFLRRHGREQSWSDLDTGYVDDLSTVAPNLCHANAARLLIRHPDDGLTYTEGVAWFPRCPRLPHAWLTDRRGAVVDITWAKLRTEMVEDPGEPRYLGVQIAAPPLWAGRWRPILDLLVRADWTPGDDVYAALFRASDPETGTA